MPINTQNVVHFGKSSGINGDIVRKLKKGKIGTMAKRTMAGSRRSIEARQKSQQAIALRMAGFNYQEIAEQVGYAGASGAYKAVMREFRETAKNQSEGVEVLRVEQDEKLNTMLRPIWGRVVTGESLEHTVVALKIEESRRNLWGIDAPKQLEARVRVDMVSWNQALRDILEVYRDVHGNNPEAELFMERIDALAQERFGVSA